MIDYTKIDFSKFDAAKMFDATQALNQIESMTHQITGYITDKKSREIAQTVALAGIEFARAQTSAAQIYVDTVKSAFQIK